MKKLNFIILLVLFSFIFTGCKNNSNPKEDIPSTVTEVSLQGTQAEFKDFEKISNISYSICVSNDTQTFNFNNYVKTAETSQWILSEDSAVMQTIPNKIGNLEIGDNYFYVLVSANDNTDKLYTLKVRRRPIYTVSYYFYVSKVEEMSVEENQTITEPSLVPEKIGYEFLGWDFDFNMPIISNISINAKYNKINYVINYYSNGGTINENSDYSESFYIDTYVSNFPTPTKSGYTFSGWYDNPSFNGNKITSISGSIAKNVTLYAKYQLNSHQLVNTASQLIQIFNDPLATQTSITLNNDIDMNGIDLPSIGTANKGYRATFNGNGHSIKNYNGSNGLFAYTNGATIKNLKIDNANLTNSNINQNSFSGILIGNAQNTLVENCSVNGEINIISSANICIGGISGYAKSVAIRNCLSNVNIDYKFHTNSDWIDSTYVYVGNLIGSCDSLLKFSDESCPKLTKCKSSGEIKIDNEYATIEVGGLIGKISSPSDNAFIDSCCSDVDIDVNGNNLSVGGLLGNGNVYTMNCYAIGNINATNTIGGKNYIGGVIAYNKNSIAKCYSDLDISIDTFGSTSETYVGGVVGYNNIGNMSVVEGCYSVGKIDAYSHYEDTLVVIGGIYAYSNLIDRILYNLELDNQQLIANKGQNLGEIIESDIKYSFEEILNIVHTTLQYPWSDSIWDFYNYKNPTLKFENS